MRFAPAILSFLRAVWGDYWIIGLGPDYTWAVVGTPSREHLWILSRTPAMSASSYDRAIEIARGNGFDVTKPRKDDQRQPAQSAATPTGQVTPVPPSPQYPFGFFDRYCW